jgi:hypothetical protein
VYKHSSRPLREDEGDIPCDPEFEQSDGEAS